MLYLCLPTWDEIRNSDWFLAFFAILGVCFVLINFVAVYAGLSTLIERKVAGHMQSRVGPYQVGPHGSLQWLADALKLMFKEDIIPRDADQLLFRFAPYVVLAGSFAAWTALPFTWGWAPAQMNVGLLYILAVSASVVLGILMSGWSSGSKWALFGAMRSAAQIVSYEVPVGLIVIGMLLIYGTLDMVEISAAQARGLPFGFSAEMAGGVLSWGVARHFPFTLIAFLVYYTASLAETNRTPFDIPEAESELVAGYHTEYSGMRFSFFFLAEYANMFVVGAVATTLFLGGSLPPFVNMKHAMATVAASLGGAGLGWMMGGVRRAGVAFLLFGGGMLVAGPFLWPGRELEWMGAEGSVLRILEGLFWFFSKVLGLVLVMMFLRWTLPRYRVDQLMDLCWKRLTPLAFLSMTAIGLGEWNRWVGIGVGAVGVLLLLVLVSKEVLSPERVPPPLPRVHPGGGPP